MIKLSAEEAISQITSGSRVVIHGSAATPLVLTKALDNRAAELRKVEIVSYDLGRNASFFRYISG